LLASGLPGRAKRSGQKPLKWRFPQAFAAAAKHSVNEMIFTKQLNFYPQIFFAATVRPVWIHPVKILWVHTRKKIRR
jgi:hypothetical protein